MCILYDSRLLRNGSRGKFGVVFYFHGCLRGLGLWSGVTVFAEHFKMVDEGFLDEGFGFREGVGSGYATGDVRQVCGVAGGRLLDDGGVFHSGGAPLEMFPAGIDSRLRGNDVRSCGSDMVGFGGMT